LNLLPTHWLDASDSLTITESSGSVSQWDDKSGNGRHVSQAILANQPTIGLATQNGLNLIYFDGSNDRLFSSNTAIRTRTIFAVCQSTGAPNLQGTLWRHAQNNFALLRHEGTTQNTIRFSVLPSASNTVGSLTGLTSFHQITGRIRDNSSWNLRLNKNLIGTTSAGAAPDNQSAAINVGGFPFSTGEIFKGYIAEIIVYEQSLSDNEIETVENYLSLKWGLGF
jgi:hypothetical protein